MRDRLDALDRATLTAWRTTNVLGWPALALLGAAILHYGVDALVTARLWLCCEIGGLTTTAVADDAISTVGQFTLRGLLSIAVAMLIASLSAKVWRRPVIASLLAAGVYAVIAVTLVHQSGAGVTGNDTILGPDGTEIVRSWQVVGRRLLLAYEALILATAPLAAWFTHRLTRRGRQHARPLR